MASFELFKWSRFPISSGYRLRHHHIQQHPSELLFYVPDLGRDVVYVLSGVSSQGIMKLQLIQTFAVSSYGREARNGVIAHDGTLTRPSDRAVYETDRIGLTYYLAFQTSSTVIAIPVDRHRMLQTPTSAPVSTLPPLEFAE